jgi:hypothetical protein
MRHRARLYLGARWASHGEVIRMTEEEIKAGVEVRVEALEMRLFTEEMTREAYETQLRLIDAWAARRLSEMWEAEK